MYLILSEMDYSALPTDPAERGKLMASFMEIVKKDLDSGALIMYGQSPGGYRGFVLSKQDPKEIYAKTSMFIPHVKFEVLPMLSIDETMDVMKEMQT